MWHLCMASRQDGLMVKAGMVTVHSTHAYWALLYPRSWALGEDTAVNVKGKVPALVNQTSQREEPDDKAGRQLRVMSGNGKGGEDKETRFEEDRPTTM